MKIHHQNARLDESQAWINISRRNINLRYADDTILMAESKEELKGLLKRVKEESEKPGLKLNIQKTKTTASGPITSRQIEAEKVEAVKDYIFLGFQVTVNDGTANMNLKTFAPWKESYYKLSILKSRDIALLTEVLISQSYGFSSSHVQMWNLDHKEKWALKN